MVHLGNYTKMDRIINDIIKSFETSSRTKKEKYNDFLLHVYMTFDIKISSCKTKIIKNKYIKMRQSALRYIVANEKAITTEICKNK